jgi:hypothetical protein
VQTFLAFKDVKIRLPEPTLVLEGNYTGPSTKYIFDVVFDEMSKDSLKET